MDAGGILLFRVISFPVGGGLCSVLGLLTGGSVPGGRNWWIAHFYIIHVQHLLVEAFFSVMLLGTSKLGTNYRACSSLHKFDHVIRG